VYVASFLLGNMFYESGYVPEDYYLPESISKLETSDIKIFNVFSSFLEAFLQKMDEGDEYHS
jgi:hypothetical protein